jgi:hypothetical protein
MMLRNSISTLVDMLDSKIKQKKVTLTKLMLAKLKKLIIKRKGHQLVHPEPQDSPCDVHSHGLREIVAELCPHCVNKICYCVDFKKLRRHQCYPSTNYERSNAQLRSHTTLEAAEISSINSDDYQLEDTQAIFGPRWGSL